MRAAAGAIVRFVVRDARMRPTLGFSGARFRAESASAPADVTITADLRDFVRLALREEDADTLFFARRLVMEDDTELALVVRNLLDTLDPAKLPPQLDGAIALLRRQRVRFAATLIPTAALLRLREPSDREGSR